MPKKNTTPLEEWEQEQVFKWIRANQIREPKLKLAYGTLNGVRLAPKLRAKMKKQGNRKGVFDIVLPARSGSGKYPGLYVELKRLKGGHVSPEQEEYGFMLAEQGYKAVICKGHGAAIEAIKQYLKVE